LNWNNLLIRSLSGLIFLIIMLGMLSVGSITFYLLISLIIVLSVIEYGRLVRYYNITIPTYYIVLIGLSLFTLSFLASLKVVSTIWFYLILVPLLFFLFVGELYRYHKKPMHNIAFSILAIVYIVIPLSLLNGLVFIERESLINNNFLDINNYDSFISDTSIFIPDQTIIYSPLIIIGYLSIIWIYDTFAYLFGVSFGKHRLFERISPKKSWEGLIGGAVLTLALTFFYPKIFHILTWQNWFILALIVIFSSTFGDLVESMFKRALSLKDSGNIMPGHGGMLDRFDSVFLSAPIAYLYIQIIL